MTAKEKILSKGTENQNVHTFKKLSMTKTVVATAYMAG